MNWFEIAKILLNLLPLIIEGINALEAAFPASGQGSIKLEALKNILKAAHDAGDQAAKNFELVWPAIQATVTSIVNAKKAVAALIK